MTSAVVGATGYTGRLIVRELTRRGDPFVAIARDASRLEALEGDFERRVADASDPTSLRDALSGCSGLVSTVGPFIDLGEPVLQIAVELGIHYIDTTGEQAYMRKVFDHYDEPARAAGSAAVPAIGFDYVPGDMAASLAAGALGSVPDRVDVFYVIRGAKTSTGTKRTGLRAAQMPCLVWEDEALREVPMGSRQRAFGFDGGEHGVAVWPGGEPLTVPRHTGARSCATYMRMPKAAAAMMRGASLASPALRAGRALVGGATGGPSDDERERGRYEVVAEAEGSGRTVRCAVRGRDMYGMTAAAVAVALERIRRPDWDRTGALAPAEAFDAAGFLGELSDYLEYEVST